jgi:hypothetical protein
MEKKQTAVEWLEEQIKDIFYVAEASEMTKKFKSVYEQAKQMEKEQIQDAHLHAQFKVVEVKKELAEKYYNDFYGGNNE